jgi:hypothetical protein
MSDVWLPGVLISCAMLAFGVLIIVKARNRRRLRRFWMCVGIYLVVVSVLTLVPSINHS